MFFISQNCKFESKFNMKNNEFIKVIEPVLVRTFGSGRVRNVVVHLSPLGLIPRGKTATPSSIAWLLCGLIFAPTTQSDKLGDWGRAKMAEWSKGENPFIFLRALLTFPGNAHGVAALFANKTVGSVTAYCQDGSELHAGPTEKASIAEIVAIEPTFIAWMADRLAEIAKAPEKAEKTIFN